MTLFLITLLLTFVLFGGAVFCINYCKSRKPRNGKHQLTGMCHRSGDVSCCSSGIDRQTAQCSK